MKKLLGVLPILALALACASKPASTPYTSVHPEPKPPVELRDLFAYEAERAYPRIAKDYAVLGQPPSRDPEFRRLCQGLPPLAPVYVPEDSEAALRAKRCGTYAAAERFRTELEAGAVPCAPVDTACALRRARIEVEHASGARFATKSPECAEFVVRYRHWLASSNDWATCDAFALFEKLQLEENPSWAAGELRACLAPHVPAFPKLVRCLPDTPTPEVAPRNLLEPEEVRAAADQLLSLLGSDAVLCSGLLGETRLAKADGLARWDALATSVRGPLVRDSIATRYGPGVLDQALAHARAQVSDFRSELCLVRN